MKNIYLLCVAVSLLALPAFAQNTGSIKGTLMDTAAKQPLPDATITVLQSGDSSLVTFSRTNKSGNFEIRYLPKGSYRLLVSHVGFRNFSKSFSITEENKSIDLGYVAMVSNSAMLDAVTITQEKAPVVIKNDTVEFNAGSFKTKPNAVVEDLLKKLPGVQVDKDGKIKANGEEVKKVLVDGKEFFGNDPKVATKNLPADIVDKVQVFDKKSDQAQFTGFDDGNSERTINLTVKPDKKHGLFGRATAGAGNKERYQGNLNLNQFKGERQFSAIAMANNTNKQGFTFMDMLNFTGGLGGPNGGRGGMIEMDGGGLPLQGMNGGNNSITTTWAGGLNFNDRWGKDLQVNGSYFFNRVQDRMEQKTNRQYISPNNPFNYYKEGITSRRNENHRLNLIADQKIDSMNSIRFTTNASFQSGLSGSTSQYNSTALKGNLLNRGFSNTSSKSDGFSWNSNALWRHRFAKKGRTLSANLSFGLNEAESTARLNSVNDFFNQNGSTAFSDSLDQQSFQDNNGITYGANLVYTEPLSKRSLLEFNYNFNSSNNASGKETFDVDSTGKYSEKNELLSSDFDNTYRFNRGGVNWRYQQKKFNFSVGARAQHASLESKFHFMGRDSAIDQSFLNVLPNAQLQYNINKYKNFRFNYITSTRQPGASQLNPIVDNTDRLNIRKGNPDLAQEYSHRFMFNFISFDPFRQTSFFSMLSFMATNNRIVNYDEFDAQGIRTTTFTNVNGVYNLNANASWGLPLKAIKSNLNINTNLGQSRNVNFVNSKRNIINNFSAGQEFSLNFVNKKTLDITLGTNISYNRVNYSLTKESNTNYWNQEYSLDANIYFPHGFSLASEFTFNRNTGYATGFNTNVALWNAGIAKQLFKNKKGEVRLQVFDILNENIGISRNANQNYIEDVSSRVLNRYFMLSFTYNISRFAGKNAPVPQQGNIKVVGERVRM